MKKLTKKERAAILGTPIRRHARCPRCSRGPRMTFPIAIGGTRVGEGCAECVVGIATGEIPFRPVPEAES